MTCPHKKVARLVNIDGETEFFCIACGELVPSPLNVASVQLRDWFAGQALSGLIFGGSRVSAAAQAYAIADAMLAERQKDKPDAERP